MTTRRSADSTPPSRPTAASVAAPDTKAAKKPPAAKVKKTSSQVAPEPVLANDAVNASPAATPVKARPPVRKKQSVVSSKPVPAVSADERRGMIAKAAYLRAERRGFAHGGEAADWLAAEEEVDALLSSGQKVAQ